MGVMSWVTCPHCGFTQIPSVECLKCRKRLDRSLEPPQPPARSTPTRATFGWHGIPRPHRIALASLTILLFVGVLYWSTRSPAAAEKANLTAPPTPAPWALDLTGRWEGKVATTIAGPPPRPALREVSLETDRSGNLVSAGVTLTDPGRGGAGAGYLTVPDGQRRLREISGALLASPRGAAPNVDFIPFPPWVPRRDRLWRALEGQRRNPEETRYLLIESLETDYLVQAGVNASGFLSYLYLSPPYASGRGTDVLSKVIHPNSDSSLRGFRSIVWDLSGAADFVGLQVNATISGPAGGLDRLVLRR
ncbi:MAG TPA: hypothetical protein VGL03_03940 [Thermoanaerobaculia bacterium]|jgi:hypothetical protein